MILNFRNPYNDELFYSILGRYLLYSGNISTMHPVSELFGKPISFRLYFPSYLETFSKAIVQNQKFTYEYFIYNHTLFPLVSMFLTKEKANKFCNLMKDDYKNSLISLLGISMIRMYKNDCIKICYQCYLEEKERCSEAYIHRCHQVNGYQVCTKHKQVLRHYIIPNKMKYQYVLDVDYIIERLEYEIPEIKDIDRFIKLGEDIETLINFRVNNYNIGVIIQKYRDMLLDKKLISLRGVIKTTLLYERFEEYYSKDFLKELDLDTDINNSCDWLRCIARVNSVTTINPIKHILFIRFLFGSMDNFIKNTEEKKLPFGDSPWPCLNPVSDHYLKNVIHDCYISKNYKKQIRGKFTCECGFEYTREGPDKCYEDRYKKTKIINYGPCWKNELRRVITNMNYYNLTQIADYMCSDKKTILRQAERLDLIQYLNSKYKKVERKDCRRKVSQDLIQEYRKILKNVINNGIELKRNEIRIMCQNQYRYLAKYDGEWLEEILPQKILINNINNFYKKFEPQRYVDLDNNFYDKVYTAVNNLKNDPECERITRNMIWKSTGLGWRLNHNTNKFPKTTKLILESIEDLKAYHERKIMNLLNEINNKYKIDLKDDIDILSLKINSPKEIRLIINKMAKEKMDNLWCE
jgi:hypothetical protein